MIHKPKTDVARRRVFYIPGYDPFPARRYRELYRAESRKQALISGYRIEQKSGKSETGWMVRSEMDGAEVQAKVDVLVWHDLVKASMRTSIPATYFSLIKTAWIYISTGTLRRLSWLSKGPVVAALYPILMLLGQLLLALTGAGIVAGAAVWLTLTVGEALSVALGRAPNTDGMLWALVAGAVSWAVFLPVVVGLLRWFKSKDDKLFAYYLMHDFAYTASRRGAYPDEIEARLREFRHRIEAALREDIDEVLIVGHSSGAQMAVSIVADIVRLRRFDGGGPALSLLTLGQSIPMVSFLPEAARLRRDLRLLSTEEGITWVDVSAPSDGCSFALTDPVAVSGVAPKGHQWPLVMSAAFNQTLKPETLKALRHRYFRLHFQYLCAFDKPGDYDYFRITAGPKTLAARFRGRRRSPSRIDVPASRFTSTIS